MLGLKIVGSGKALPSKIMTNDDLSNIVDTSDEWITTRTGIKQRYYSDGENNWEIALKSANAAIEDAGIDKKDIGLVIVATFTPDYATPSMACIIQKELGLESGIMAFDINAACSGFLYALEVACSLLENNKDTYALIIGSEQISTRIDMQDRTTCVLFGDGAGSVVVKKTDSYNWNSIMGAEGNIEALGCNGQTSDKPYIFMDGKAVFKFAVSTIQKSISQLLGKSGLTIDDIDHVLCHQANERIIKSVMNKYPTAKDKFYMNIQNYGNTSAASIPIALDEMRKSKILKTGDKLLCVGFGAGFTWGAAIITI